MEALRIHEPRTAERCERRRTVRFQISIPLFVYGHTPEGLPFYEDTRTMVISAHGGLVSLRTPVQPGQRLLVTNTGNDYSQECVVVFVQKRSAQPANVAFEFPAATPEFLRHLEIGEKPSF